MKKGFTLAELLVALTILGVIATFTIPKVLTSQQEAKNKSIAKEAASMVSGAYEAYKQQNTATANTTFAQLTPYMNYVSVDTTSTIDGYPLWTDQGCNTGNCLRLHNGATLFYRISGADRFGSTATTSAMYFYADTDGHTVTGQRKSVLFFMYFNGRITSANNVLDNTQAADGSTYNPGGGADPAWFNWN